MRARHVVTIGRLAAAVLLAIIGLVALPGAGTEAAGAAPRRCESPRSTGTAAAPGPKASGPHRVTGVACGQATLDYSVSPPTAETSGTVVLTRIGRARFTSTLEVNPAPDPGFYATSGTLTVSARRGTITFDYDGLVPVFPLAVGESSTGPARIVAVSGTGAFRRVSGSLDLVVTSTVTGLPAPGTATFDVRFTAEGALSFRGRPPDPGPVPDQVTQVLARTSAGSGETEVVWGAAAGATGYRVLRSTSPGGRFTLFADIDVVTGATTAAPEVIFINSAQHTYDPPSGPLPAPDTSPEFRLIEFSEADQRCYRVVAYNAAGEAPPSPTVCAFPP